MFFKNCLKSVRKLSPDTSKINPEVGRVFSLFSKCAMFCAEFETIMENTVENRHGDDIWDDLGMIWGLSGMSFEWFSNDSDYSAIDC